MDDFDIDPHPDFKDLHRVLLMIAEDFDRFCKTHKIQYYLMGGTALGAMRHKGFIPWDDDFDVFMDRVNYLTFLDCAKTHLDTDKYYLQMEDTQEWPLFFSKIRLNGTSYKEEHNSALTLHEGVFIDIMCLNNAYQHRPLRYVQYLAARVLSAQALSKKGYTAGSIKKRLSLILAPLICRGFVKQLLKSLAVGFEKQSSPIVGHFFGRAPFPRTSFSRAALGAPRYVDFEHLQLPVPEKVEDYLTIRYGPKYMDPPSKAVRALYPSHAVEVDLGVWAKQ
jgi:lipopolysaccharide cholinephosphotransferase